TATMIGTAREYGPPAPECAYGNDDIVAGCDAIVAFPCPRSGQDKTQAALDRPENPFTAGIILSDLAPSDLKPLARRAPAPPLVTGSAFLIRIATAATCQPRRKPAGISS